MDRKALRDPLDSERTGGSHTPFTESEVDIDEEEEDRTNEKCTRIGENINNNNSSGDRSELKKAHTAMAQHICATVEKVTLRNNYIIATSYLELMID